SRCSRACTRCRGATSRPPRCSRASHRSSSWRRCSAGSCAVSQPGQCETDVRARPAVMVAVALFCAALPLAAQTAVVVEDWRDAGGGGRLPAGWSFYGREPQLKFSPAVVVDEGRRALWLKTEHYSV